MTERSHNVHLVGGGNSDIVGRHTGFQEPNGKQFTKLRLGYSGYHDYVCVCVCGYRNDGNEFSGSLFQKVSEKVDVGAQLSWSGANSMRFGLAAKFCAHPDTTFRVSSYLPVVSLSFLSVCDAGHATPKLLNGFG